MNYLPPVGNVASFSSIMGHNYQPNQGCQHQINEFLTAFNCQQTIKGWVNIQFSKRSNNFSSFQINTIISMLIK